MYQGKIKKSEKLPRGTYLYLTVGDRFYAGEEVALVTDEVRKPLEPYIPMWADKWSKGMASYLRKQGRRIPTYHVHEDTRAVREPKQAVTGTSPKLTDEFKEVKQFRRLIQAEAACERLNKLYAGLDIRVRIELHEGGK
jgi:hypothetical protein